MSQCSNLMPIAEHQQCQATIVLGLWIEVFCWLLPWWDVKMNPQAILIRALIHFYYYSDTITSSTLIVAVASIHIILPEKKITLMQCKFRISLLYLSLHFHVRKNGNNISQNSVLRDESILKQVLSFSSLSGFYINIKTGCQLISLNLKYSQILMYQDIISRQEKETPKFTFPCT